MFTHSEVIVLTKKQTNTQKINPQTNKQTPLKTSNALHYAMTLGNKLPCRTALYKHKEPDTIQPSLSQRHKFIINQTQQMHAYLNIG